MTYCDEELLEAYALGVAPEDDGPRIRAHVGTCAACAACLARIRRDMLALEGAVLVPNAAPLPDFDAIVATAKRRPRVVERLPRSPQRVAALGAAFAAAAAFALSFHAVSGNEITEPTIVPLAAEEIAPLEDLREGSFMSRAFSTRAAQSPEKEGPTCGMNHVNRLACGPEDDSFVTRASFTPNKDDVCQ